jgi:putative FmdB family regulatory protein
LGFDVPIYEYYCRACDGRFSHLARHIDAAAPPCPRCGDGYAERLISAGHVLHGTERHTQDLREDAAKVLQDDPQAAARMLKASGRLEDASGLYGSRVYRELIERRIEGAADADLADLVEDLVGEAATAEAAQMASAVVLSDQVEDRLAAEGPPAGEESGDDDSVVAPDARTGPGAPRSRRRAAHLGWG